MEDLVVAEEDELNQRNLLFRNFSFKWRYCFGSIFCLQDPIYFGGLQYSLKKAAIVALLEYLESSDTKDEYNLSNDLLWVLNENRKCDRFIVPTLKGQIFVVVFLNLLIVNIELKGSKDFSELITGITTLGYFDHSVPSCYKTRVLKEEEEC